MRFEGDIDVIRNYFRKQRLLRAGDSGHMRYRTALMACSGVLRGVCGGGTGRAMERFGLSDVSDVAVGVSTGAPVLAFLLANQLHKHTGVYWTEAASREFISLRRFLLRRGPIADTDYLCGVFREKLNQQAVMQSRTQFFVAATCAATGEGYLLDTKCAEPDVLEAVHASIALPMLCGRVVKIGDREYLDGSGAMNFPARQIISQFDTTDLLVIANCPHEKKTEHSLKAWLTKRVLRGFPEPVQRAFITRNKRFEEGVRYLRAQKAARWAIVWTDESIGQFEFNRTKLENAGLKADAFMHQLLSEEKECVEQEKN